MSSTKSNSIESGTAGQSSRSSRGPVIQVVVTMGLLAALVWTIKPSRPGLKPAPLRPISPECPKLLRQFTPTNLTDVAGLRSAPSLSKESKDRALFRLNMEPCPCGCNRSLIACRTDYPRCATSERLTQEVVADEKVGAGPSEKH